MADELVSITVRHVHDCVPYCVYNTLWRRDFGSILRCDNPYLNDCYCATSGAGISKVSEYATQCANQECSAGDFSNDLRGIKSAYRSYCSGAGYSQPGLENWYTPARATTDPTSTTDEESDVGETTTEWTTVTETTTGHGSSPTRPRVVVQATSTLWVDKNGSPVAAPSNNGSGSGMNTVTLGAGLGAGLGVALLIIISVLAWLCIRRRRHQPHAHFPSAPGPVDHQTSTMVALPPPPLPIATALPDEPARRLSRKPVPCATTVPSPVSELTSQGARPELGSKSVSPVPVSPRESTEPQQTQYQVGINVRATAELYGQGGSPPPHYHRLQGIDRTELP